MNKNYTYGAEIDLAGRVFALCLVLRTTSVI